MSAYYQCEGEINFEKNSKRLVRKINQKEEQELKKYEKTKERKIINHSKSKSAYSSKSIKKSSSGESTQKSLNLKQLNCTKNKQNQRSSSPLIKIEQGPDIKLKIDKHTALEQKLAVSKRLKGEIMSNKIAEEKLIKAITEYEEMRKEHKKEIGYCISLFSNQELHRLKKIHEAEDAECLREITAFKNKYQIA